MRGAGWKVATAVAVNERKAPGIYSVQFDASGLASGVFLYRLMQGLSSIREKCCSYGKSQCTPILTAPSELLNSGETAIRR
jgi:hypothetical protein